MPFDHGQRRIAPLNLLLILAALILWWPVAPWWLLALSVVLGILFTGDHYVGMFIVFVVAFVVAAVGLVYRMWS